MPKLPVLSGPELVKLALERGWAFARQKGSHAVLCKGQKLTVIPLHGQRPLKKGLTLPHSQGHRHPKRRTYQTMTSVKRLAAVDY